MFTLCGLCAVGVTVFVICLNVKKNKKVWRYGFFSLYLHLKIFKIIENKDTINGK